MIPDYETNRLHIRLNYPGSAIFFTVPDDIIAQPRTYYLDKRIPGDSDDSEDEDLVFYSSFPLPERGSRALPL